MFLIPVAGGASLLHFTGVEPQFVAEMTFGQVINFLLLVSIALFIGFYLNQTSYRATANKNIIFKLVDDVRYQVDTTFFYLRKHRYAKTSRSSIIRRRFQLRAEGESYEAFLTSSNRLGSTFNRLINLSHYYKFIKYHPFNVDLPSKRWITMHRKTHEVMDELIKTYDEFMAKMGDSTSSHSKDQYKFQEHLINELIINLHEKLDSLHVSISKS